MSAKSMAHFTGRSYNGGNRQKGEDKMSELLKMEHLVKYYGNKTSLTKALNDISLTVEQGEFTATAPQEERSGSTESAHRS